SSAHTYRGTQISAGGGVQIMPWSSSSQAHHAIQLRPCADKLQTQSKGLPAVTKGRDRSELMIVISSIVTGISIETSFQFGWTPLMCAASVANFAVVRLLLDRGANACFEIDKYTVLMAACTAQASEENILNTVELLLSRNADPNLACR
uniref:Ankyrin repeat protein n=1 Tax=Serinus canaria TaxID=9135 RepID=A0A8C9N664_SERCA